MPTVEYQMLGMTDSQSRESARSVCRDCKALKTCSPQVYVELMRDNSKQLKVVGNNAGDEHCPLPSVLNST